MFCTNCGKKLSVGENFCTNCGHKAPVLADSPSIDAQTELLEAQHMLSAVQLPDMQSLYAHLDKAANCKDQALLQQLKALADKYADIAKFYNNTSIPLAQPSPSNMNPYMKAAAIGAVGAGVGTMAASAMSSSTAEAASSAGSTILSPNVGAQLADHFIRDNHDTLSDAASDIADTASDVADAASDTVGDVIDFLSDIL